MSHDDNHTNRPRRRRIATIALPIIAIILLLFGIALIVAGIIIIYKVVPNTVHDQVVDQKSLGDDIGNLNELTKDWANPKYESYIQYWVYNYTNVLEIMNRGARPAPQEKGPYAYKETIINNVIEFNTNGTIVAYENTKTYEFDPSMSCDTCLQNDTVTFPDILFYTFLDTLLDAEALYELLNEAVPGLLELLLPLLGVEDLVGLQALIDKDIAPAIGTIFTTFDATPFTTQTVNDLLFGGYNSPIITKILPSLMGLISFLVPTLPPLNLSIPIPPVAINTNNDTGTGVYHILTGKGDIANVGQIRYFNATKTSAGSNGTTLSEDWWANPDTKTCPPEYIASARDINGTSGDFFKPFISKDDRLYLYVSDICRSLYLDFDQEVTVKGIDGYRFAIPTLLFESKLENCGFCHPVKPDFYKFANQSCPPSGNWSCVPCLPDGPTSCLSCLPGGLLDISRCQNGKPPIAVSNPHFYGADKSVIDFIVGQHPTPDSDQTFIDIEPTTGTVLTANKRLQVNLMVHSFIGHPWTALPSGPYPIVWINESFTIDDGSRDQIYNDLIKPQRLIKIICWICVGIGVFMIIVAFALILLTCYCCRLPASKTDNISYTNVPAPTIFAVSADEQHSSTSNNHIIKHEEIDTSTSK